MNQPGDPARRRPDDACYACQGTNLEFREMPGTGRVESAVLVDHPIHPALRNNVPYVIAVVSIDGEPGCQVTGNVVSCPPERVGIGDRVRAVFEDAGDPASDQPLKIPQWALAEG